MKFVLILAVIVIGYLYFTGKLQQFMGGASAPAMSEQQARALLGVGRGSRDEDIIAAHREMMAQHHPDKGGNAEIARQLNEARDTLLGKQRKKDLK